MPPRVQNVNAAGTGVNAWYSSLPVVTRSYATAIFAFTCAARFQLLSLGHFALIWDFILKKFQVWRLVSSFFYMGGFSLPWIVRFIWLIQYGSILESQTFQFDPAGFVFMLVFGAGCMLALSFVTTFILNWPFYFNGGMMVFMILYVWSRQFPEQRVSIYGLFQVLSFYVPFIFLAITFLMGGLPWDDIAGVVIGHMYYYLTVLYPAATGRELLKTPRFLSNLVADLGLGGQRVNTHAATGQAQFSAFRGRAMRLGAQ